MFKKIQKVFKKKKVPLSVIGKNKNIDDNNILVFSNKNIDFSEISNSSKKFLNINKNFPSDNKSDSHSDKIVGTYLDSLAKGVEVRYFCPIGFVFKNRRCTKNAASKFNGWRSISALHSHIQDHCRSKQFNLIPSKYWEKYHKRFCKTCGVIISQSNTKHNEHFFLENFVSNIPERKMLSEDEDSKAVCLDDLKNNKSFVMSDEKIMDVEVDPTLPSWEEIWSTYCPTILSIPSPLISDWCKILENLLNPLTSLKPDQTEDDWKKFFIVCKYLWFAPSRSGKKKREVLNC